MCVVNRICLLRKLIRRRACLGALFLLVLLLLQTVAMAAPKLEKVAESDKQWTGVAVSQQGRIFVNYPTWNDYPDAYRVAELVNGQSVPYPSADIQKEFVCVQSVVVDDADHLWILDPAKLKDIDVAASGARLYEVDLATNRVLRVFVIPETAALPKSYLNDVRIDLQAQKAYMTDSGLGGIVVLDLATGEAWRALTDIPEVKANLKEIDFKSTGPNTHLSQSDGLELSADKSQLYFTSLGGDILYEVPVRVLNDRKLTVMQRQKAIRVLNAKNVPTDGMILKDGSLYMADLPQETIWQYDLKTHQGRDLDLGETIRWADSFAKAPDGSLYFTTSEINYPKEQRKPYGLYRLTFPKP